jgi:PAS domain S-box-containing protein
VKSRSKNPAKSKAIKKTGSQTEEKYLSILKELPDIVYEIEPNGHFTFVNNAICILGYKPKDLIGKHFSKIVHPDDVKLFSRHYVLPKYKGEATGYKKAPKLIDERRTGKRKTENLQIRLMPKKRKKKSAHAAELYIGEVIALGDVSSAGYYIGGNKKKFLGTLGIIREVTERIQTYNDLNVSKDKYQKLVDSMNSGLVEVDKQDKILFVNKQLCTMLGYKQEELINKTGYKILFSKEDQKAILYYNRRRLRKLFDQYEIKMKRKSGDYIWTQIRGSPIFDSNGVVQSSMGIITDISDRKEQEAKLHYQADLLTHVSDAVFSIDNDTIIRTWNRAAERIYGWEAHEAIDKPLHKVTKPEYPEGETVKNIYKKLSKKGYWTGVVFERRKDGKAIIINKSMAQIIDTSGNIIGVVAVDRDITDVRHAVQKLRESEEKYRHIVESAPDGIVTVNKKGIITSVNMPFCQRTGFSKKQIVGKHISKMPTVRAEDIPKYIKIFSALLRGKVPKFFEFRSVHKDKSVYWDEIHVSQMKVDGKIVGHQAIIRDITERKTVEDSLKASLNEKEALLKEIHHRVKNNLQIISSLLNLQARYIHDESYKEIFQESQNRIKSMVLVHEKLYQSKDITAINLRDYVDGLIKYLSHSYGIKPNRIAVKTDIEDITMNIDIAIPCGLIINELVSNSLKHAFVEPNRDSHAEITIRLHRGKKNGTVLIVSDNGVSFPDSLDFRNTESLGLQLVCILTEQLSGNIKLARDKGTTFTITFKKRS